MLDKVLCYVTASFCLIVYSALCVKIALYLLGLVYDSIRYFAGCCIYRIVHISRLHIGYVFVRKERKLL